MNTHPQAACAIRLASAGNTLQLFPAGEFRADDGRPKDAPHWRIDAKIAARLAQAVRGRIVIDYEHQTIAAATNGQPAPAAGWFQTLEWREGEGLFAAGVEWTEKAKAMIQAGEYLFISPVFTYDRSTGAVQSLVSAALTNTPALSGMAEVTALSRQAEESNGADPFAALRELASRHGDRDALAALRSAEESLQHALAALTAKDQFTADLRRTADALQVELRQRAVDEVLDLAMAEGRLIPAHREAALRLGALDLEALKAVLTRPPMVPPNGHTQTGGKPPAGAALDRVLSPEEKRICNLTGRSHAEFAQLKRRFESEDSGRID